MKLSALIATIGDDNVRFQNLDQCAEALNWTLRSGSKITFFTPETIIAGEGTKRLGLVLWLDRAAVAAALKAEGVELRSTGGPDGR